MAIIRSRKKPSRNETEPDHPARAAASIVAASLAMIVIAPLFVYAVDGASLLDAPSGDTGANSAGALSAEIADLKKDMLGLNGALTALTGKIQSQQESFDALASKSEDTGLTGEGIGVCLSACRATAVTCLRAASSTAVNATGFVAGEVGNQGEITCRRTLDTCALTCKPKPTPPVSCEARCAVGFGACIRAAGDGEAAVFACRVADRFCLASACASPSKESTFIRASRVPAASCLDQCRLESTACVRAAAYNTDALADCRKVSTVCREVACKGVEAEPSVGQEYTIVCENDCTARFNACRIRAAGGTGSTASCNSRYGVCRNTCTKAVGGSGLF